MPPSPPLAEDAPVLALGLMSGTSLDGIDAALVRTDGANTVEAGAWLTLPYDDGFRNRLRGVLGTSGDTAAVVDVERALTDLHAAAVARLLDDAGVAAREVAVIGFHGHTIWHWPQSRRAVRRGGQRGTWQIGDGGRLAACTGIDVVNDFRSADVAAGGEGAPLAPVFHAALAHGLPKPLAVLNIGGIANVTWIGADSAMLAFDTGPGNALLDDWAQRHTGRPVDLDGRLARAGRTDAAVLARLLGDPWFAKRPPKSLDRLDFDLALLAQCTPADGAATLAGFTAAAVASARAHMPAPPRRWLVTGGGRRNPAIMAALRDALGVPVDAVETVSWNGDALEAQAFAYLAVRSLRGLPLSFPGTTAVPEPLTGGVLHRAALPVEAGGAHAPAGRRPIPA